jgi:hypothetical protein
LLHAGGQVGRFANGGVVHVQIVANRSDDDLPRVESHADLHLYPVRAPHLIAVTAQRVLHGQGGIAGAHGVVLVGERGAKECHDAIAHDLVDGAFVAMYRRHHALQHGIEELPGLFGITVGEQLHRALQIGKQHRDLLTLAFQGTTRGENFLCEIRWGVSERRLLRGLAGHSGGGSGVSIARPDQDVAPLIDRQALALDEFILQILQGRVVELELPLQGAVGHPAPLAQEGDHVIYHRDKVHPVSSLPDALS